MSDLTSDPEGIVKYVVSTKLRCDSASALQRREATGCPAQFDGVVCWLPTPPGVTALQQCPQLLQQTEDVLIVNRTCDETGDWRNVSGPDYGTLCGLNESQLSAMEQTRARLETRETESVVTEVRKHVLQLYQECINKSRHTPHSEGHCPVQFDGFSCWDQTPAGQMAQHPCPSFITGFDPTRFARRSCLGNATWYRLPEQANSTLGWSNYTTCVDVDDLEFRLNVNSLYVCGYSISCLALFISLVIFLSFRSLNCTRILIHVHLFLSFAANNVMWVVWYLCVVEAPEIIQKNEWPCQLLHVLLQYMMVANYMWMFCEGLHLHLALVVVFVKDEVAMRWFYCVGWGAPAAITLAYALARFYRSEDDTRQCWINESETQWILTVPVLVSLVASAVFLVNVVRVLLTKLHSSSAHPAPAGLRKAVRATLILVPLFGLHHMLIPVKPHRNEPAEYFYQIFAAIVVSLQGFCVSCLFCFANVDVHYAVRPFLRRACPCLRPGAALTDSGGGGCAVNTQTQSRDVCV